MGVLLPFKVLQDASKLASESQKVAGRWGSAPDPAGGLPSRAATSPAFGKSSPSPAAHKSKSSPSQASFKSKSSPSPEGFAA